MAPVLGRRGIKLTTLHKNAVLHIDRELFLSLLYNLIDNAAKASPDNSESGSFSPSWTATRWSPSSTAAWA